MAYRNTIGGGVDPRKVPTQQVALDPTHPLALGVIGLWLPGLGGRDYANLSAPMLPQGGVSFAPSAMGAAGSFASASSQSWISNGDVTTGSLGTANQSWAAWVCPATNGSAMQIAARDSNTTLRCFNLCVNEVSNGGNVAGAWSFGIIDTGGGGALLAEVASNVVPTGVWTHLVGVRTGTTTIALYRNGVLESSSLTASFASSITGASPLTIGQREYSGFQSYYNGQIASVTAYNRALSASDVAGLYVEPFAMLRPVVRRQYYGAAAAVPVNMGWLPAIEQPRRSPVEMVPY